MFILTALLLLALTSAAVLAQEQESFHEELLLQPLRNGDLLAHFRFTTLTDDGDKADFRLFPRAIGELVRHHSLRELEVSLTRGVWREDVWGSHAPESAPAGAKVAAWFNQDVTDVGDAWRRLTNALAGQLCASLNFMDSQQPSYAFRPRGVTQKGQHNNGTLFRVGALPGENVCTENLSPWKKLLPCQSKRGLATLLNPGSIHRTRYHSLGLSMRHVCKSETTASCTRTSIEFVQSVSLVFSPNLWPENYDKKVTSWSVRSLFGMGLSTACPLAASSRIFIDNSEEELSFGDGMAYSEATKSKVLIFETKALLAKGSSNIIVNQQRNSTKALFPPPLLQATRYISGYGQQDGEVVTRIKNPSKIAVGIVFFDVLPWYLRLYFHTLKITQNGQAIQPKASVLIPGIDRVRPYSLELVLQLPPKSVTTISVSFEKSILKWLEYPPDANHGFYVGPAMITSVMLSKHNVSSTARTAHNFYSTFMSGDSRPLPELVRIYTETLLVNLPTPDFSMPYNVICLACTVVALAFGPLHNITTKQLVLETGGSGKKSMVNKVLDRVCFWKKHPEGEEDVPDSQSAQSDGN